jgi:hypothetical protein
MSYQSFAVQIDDVRVERSKTMRSPLGAHAG